MSSTKTWHALESDPEIWRVYIEKLGVDLDSLDFNEIYSLDEDFPLDPSIFAFVFLYPTNESTSTTTSNVESSTNVEQQLWTIKQIEELDSCCCLIALLHSIGNNLDKIRLKPNSPLAEFFDRTKSMNADERANFLLHNERIHQAHEETAEQGQTEMLESERVGYHYIAFIRSKTNQIYEMNGSTRGPQAKWIGEATEEKFSSAITKEVKRRVELLNGDIRFNLVGLAQK